MPHVDAPALDENHRRVVFAMLVSAQDDGFSVPASREFVARKYGLTPEQVREVEREGLAQSWPPL